MAQLYTPRRQQEVIEQYEVVDEPSEIIYKCARCGYEMTYEDIISLPSIKCLQCGFRILYKVRAPGSKIIRAV